MRTIAPQDIDREIENLDKLAKLLDSRFRVLGFRFGLDGIASVVPVLGDAVTTVPAAWLIWRAHKMGVPRSTLARMAMNTGVDFAGGSVPVLGTIFDLFFKSNLKNMDLLRRHLHDRRDQSAIRPGGSEA